ncbi:MAG: hypothetical protein IKR66_06980 [Bacteroidales bacterium]|nr:hypothetical protein [Bacteroidales bacterium]
MSKEDKEESRKIHIQLGCAVVGMVLGSFLMIFGVIVEPKGVIDYSIIVACGEILTFVAALLGIDYKYKFEIMKLKGKK